MDDGGRITGTERAAAGGAVPTDGTKAVRPGPTWRALILSILAAIVLSVAATLLLGGSFRPTGASNGAPAGSGAHGPCCPLPGDSDNQPVRGPGQR